MLRDIRSEDFAMGFAQRLAALRKERSLTQQALSELADLHIVQICRYETGKTEPTLEAVRKLAKALHVQADALAFDQHERDPDEDFRLLFEALQQLPPNEKAVARSVLESLVIRHAANRWSKPIPA